MNDTYIASGQRVFVKTAFGRLVEKRAVTGVIPGDKFPVVRVCSNDEWETAERQGRTPSSSPWPAEDVSLARTEEKPA